MIITEHKPHEILQMLENDNPGTLAVTKLVSNRVSFYKRQVGHYQGALLYVLAQKYNYDGARILEIGTAHGYSAGCIASGAPLAKMITLNPKPNEIPVATENLKMWPNVRLIPEYSRTFLKQLYDYNGDSFDMIFVDGDHAGVRWDMPFWNFLNVGGLMIHHDYSPEDSARPCPPVYDAVNEFSFLLGRTPDVLVVDDKGVGMAGHIKQSSDLLVNYALTNKKLIVMAGG